MDETTATRADEAVVPEKKPMNWEQFNIMLMDGTIKEPTNGYYGDELDANGKRKYHGSLLSIRTSVSDSGYELGYGYSNEDYEWSDEPTRYAYRLYKRNPLGVQIYTPWIPCSDRGSDGEREAMYAYAQLLRTGKLPEVDRRGKLKGEK
jgi:hypothetical protein